MTLPLYYIQFIDGTGHFFTSRYARYACLEDLLFDVAIYNKRFPGHTATWTLLNED